MDIIFDLIFFMAFVASITMNAILIKKLSKVHSATLINTDEMKIVNREISELRRHLFVLSQGATSSDSSMKPNNWDNLRDAFRGPSRVNERN